MMRIKTTNNKTIKQVVSFNNILSMTEHFVPILLSFYIGAWSDRHRPSKHNNDDDNDNDNDNDNDDYNDVDNDDDDDDKSKHG